MENAPIQTTNESAPDKRDYISGTLPKRTNTVTAAVLAALLESKTLTGLDSVFAQSTTRLGGVIHRLERDYGWRIDRKDFVAGTSDGRVAHPSAYWLPQAAIAKAFEAGAGHWIETVIAARMDRRKLAGECRKIAARSNATRKQFKHPNPRQDSLWGHA